MEKKLTLNQRLRVLRKTMGMSQVQVAKQIPISSSYIAGLELGKRKANDRILKLICTTFSVNENWLRTGEGEIFSKQQQSNTDFIKLNSLYKELHPSFKKLILKEIESMLDIQQTLLATAAASN
ncbi:MAG: helix-turn-helix domain-containing protein [Spirochaetaceae bacterium]|jgi:transcriptional regulator with XRE-family HTH domain|nr:helix-turn-helix domain-containing protein [Spirochaetaceae bacterium]